MIVATTALTVLHWFFPLVYQAWYAASGVGVMREFDTTTFSWGQKVSGFMVEAFASALLIYGLLLVIQLMSLIKVNQYFTLATITLLKRISKIALLYCVYAVICGMALSVITTLHNQPGERVVAITFGTADLINIMVFCCMFLMMTIFQKGYEMKHEQDLTI